MADRVEIDPESLRKSGEKTRNAASDFRTIKNDLIRDLAFYEGQGPGMPWGDDEMGGKFRNGKSGDGYAVSKQQVEAGLDAFAVTLDAYADGQYDTAKGYEGSEFVGTEDFKGRPKTNGVPEE